MSTENTAKGRATACSASDSRQCGVPGRPGRRAYPLNTQGTTNLTLASSSLTFNVGHTTWPRGTHRWSSEAGNLCHRRGQHQPENTGQENRERGGRSPVPSSAKKKGGLRRPQQPGLRSSRTPRADNSNQCSDVSERVGRGPLPSSGRSIHSLYPPGPDQTRGPSPALHGSPMVPGPDRGSGTALVACQTPGGTINALGGHHSQNSD